MSVRITTLSENTAGMGNFLAEWGLSILVETEKTAILLDTGSSISAVHNADALDIDLTKIDKIVLSHGHHDHTGGLRQLLQKMKRNVEIVAHPDIWQAKYARRQNEPDRYIGIPFQRNEMESLGATFNLTAKPERIDEDIMSTGEIPMVTSFEQIDAVLFVKKDTRWQPDTLLDDQALIVNTDSGLVVVLGCAHRGIINTLYHARQLTGRETIYAVIGGAHLISASEERIWQTMAALKELNVQRLGLCHCTDLPATCLMAQEFGEKFFFNKAGTSIEFYKNSPLRFDHVAR
jgi:7,8-dihydropterin-6-yl-methyl-4-(beta-D-ribofuranosyl)aminobenzene 5'-phosphate synthase